MNSYTFRTQDTSQMIHILHRMYVDNQHAIQSLQETMHRLIENNAQIESHLFELINHNSSSSQRASRRANHNEARAVSRITMNREPRVRQSNDWGTIHQLLQEIVTDPVVLPLTTAEIEAETRRVRYSDITRPVNTACPISLEDFEDQHMVTIIRHCGHTFHTEPLMNWFRTNSRCPVCRHDLRETTASPWETVVNEPVNVSYTTFPINSDMSGNALTDLFLHAFRNISRI